MTDETLLAEKVGALEEEKRQLKKEVEGLRADLRWKTFRHGTITFLVITFLVIALGWLGWKAINSRDTDECYIKATTAQCDVFLINRRVEWWPDRTLGSSPDLDKALEIGRKQGCKALQLPEVSP